MKKILIVMLLVFVPYLLQAMGYNRPYWEDYTDKLLKIKTVQFILQSDGITIPLVTMHQKIRSTSQTIFLFLVYPDDDQQKECYESYTDNTYRSFQYLLLDLPQHIHNCIPGKFCLISCKYSKNIQSASRCLAALMHQVKQRDGLIATYAFGESAHIVNLATREYKKEFGNRNGSPIIDTMFHVQSPIYEYSWSWLQQEYEYNKQFSPTRFNKLYHFYTKAALPVSLYNVLTYPDRKYRQKKHESYDGKKRLPVTNIRLLKNNNENQLVDMSVHELKTEFFIKRINDLLNNAKKYWVNFDLMAKARSDDNEFEPSVVIINRSIGFEKGAMLLKYGGGTDQQYKFGTISEKSNVTQIAFNERGLSKNAVKSLVAKYENSFKNNKDLERVHNEHK